MVEPQTFVEPVSDVVERLSAAGATAARLSTGFVRVALTIEWLGVTIRAVLGTRNLERTVGWLEIDQAKMNILEDAIQAVVKEIRYG